METNKDVCYTNLEKLKSLVDKLEGKSIVSDEYQDTLKNIEKVIKMEKKVIINLKKSETKLQHYEGICNSILSIISTAKV